MKKNLTFKAVGVSPLLMHSGQMIDPLNPWSKLIKTYTSKRKKTDEDHLEIARLEWLASLYLAEEKSDPVIPSDNVEALFIEGAKKMRLGVQAKSGAWCETEHFPLIYDGPKDADELWKDTKFRLIKPVVVGQARVMRTRPMFREWSVKIDICFDSDILSESDAVQILNHTQNIGLGDWRPKYGRFQIEEVKVR